jgi:SsrA-binding protein
MAKEKDRIKRNIEIRNRKASFEYQFMATYSAGIMLTGTEIKSIREGNANLTDAHCVFLRDELYVVNLYIAPYFEGTHYNHEPRRQRKLLLEKRELKQLAGKASEQGVTIIPFRLFINERGFAKLEIALAKGKKLFDKREDIKAKDMKREMERL